MPAADSPEPAAGFFMRARRFSRQAIEDASSASYCRGFARIFADQFFLRIRVHPRHLRQKIVGSVYLSQVVSFSVNVRMRI
jgi:hypothetical protein